ncbi:MAG: Hsp70 family protein [Anaerolineaceae bacterium]|nr:MAG: Hsp70 family protein [Anaerolineaceae bacterium]
MSRGTINFGIDLGTTNSAIAMLNGSEIDIIRGEEGFEYTPSAVYIDSHNSLYTGRVAKERVEDDPENAFMEFKLQMGKDHRYQFARSGQMMSPEELSSEVLKALRHNVRQSTGEDISAAVITVPADFDLPENQATRRAAELAGFKQSPLLQEPAAAALAYGFQDVDERAFWLVYDLGGGTFDAAVVQVRDGMIEVVNHGGDKFLGGKLIDWAIVEQLFIPHLVKDRQLTDFRRGNKQWAAAIAKLKIKAEEAKVRLSNYEATDVRVDFLCLDDRREPVEFFYRLERADLMRIAEPFILRSINICKHTLAEKRLSIDSIQKVLLVGGQTMMPYLREWLADADEGLGIPLEYSINPLTVVAHGAAIYAGTQPLTREVRIVEVDDKDSFHVNFAEWKFAGSDIDPLVGGTVKAPEGKSVEGYTIRFINEDARPPWRSGEIRLSANGGFMTTLRAETGEINTFEVELRDSVGTQVKTLTDPDALVYNATRIDIGSIPLTHNVGVQLANNEVEWIIKKGTPLAARGRCILRTTINVNPGHHADVIRIPVVEGQNPRADRNRRIGHLEVKAAQVTRTVPAGSEVEFSVEIDESRQVKAVAYVPLLDEDFEEVLHLSGDVADLATLRQQMEQERERLQAAQRRVTETPEPRAQQALELIEHEQKVHQADVSLNAAEVDPDAVDKSEETLRDLKSAIDEVEDYLEWPTLVNEAERILNDTRTFASEHGTPEERRQLLAHDNDLREAMRSHDVDLLRRRVEELRGFLIRALDRTGIVQVIYFQQLSQLQGEMRDTMLATQLISQGLQAMNGQDTERLRTINRQLAGLLPSAPPPPDVSTVMRG